MTITVLDLDESIKRHKEFDFIISLVDMDLEKRTMRENMPQAFAHAIYNFEDEDEDHKPGAPTLDQIQDIFQRWDRWSDMGHHPMYKKNVLVHCHGGICRSTAVGIGLLICRHGMSPMQAYDHMMQIRPQMWPNKLIIQYIDEAEQLGGYLIKYDEMWKKQNLGKFWIGPPKRNK